MSPSDAPTPRAGKLVADGSATFSGIDATILMGGPDAVFTVMEMTVAPGEGSPRHISVDEDKVFLVRSGELAFLVGEDVFHAESGETVSVPRGLQHSFRAMRGPASMTLVATPARHDRFFRSMDALPLPHDGKDVQAVCREFGQIITGPVVEAGTSDPAA